MIAARKKWLNPGIQGLGVSVGTAAEVALQVAADPALGPFIERLKTLHEIEAENATANPSVPTPTPGPPTVGIGLQNFLAPLDAYIFMKRRPWVFWGIVGGVVLGIGSVGYKLGRKRRAVAP